MKHPDIALIFLPMASLAAYVVIHAVCSRLTQGRRHLFVLFAGFLAGLIFQTAAEIHLISGMEAGFPDKTGWFITDLLTYAALAYGYFGFVNLNFASLRIRMLKEILAAGKNGLGMNALMTIYNPDGILETRLGRLVNWGQLAEKNGKYLSGKNGFLTAAEIIDLVKLIVLGRRSL